MPVMPLPGLYWRDWVNIASIEVAAGSTARLA
jgi:hypothetical protein